MRNNKRTISIAISAMTGIIATVSVVATMSIFINDIGKTTIKVSQDENYLIQTKIDSLSTLLNILQQNIKKDSLPTTKNISIKKIENQINDINIKINNLYEVILENPEKAVTLPLLKKDIANINETYKKDIAALKEEVLRLFDLFKWLIGLLFALSISLLSLAIGNLFQKYKQNVTTT